MIGVIAPPADLPTVREFFELFKTPWEIAVPGRKYGALVSTDANVANVQADVMLLFTSLEGNDAAGLWRGASNGRPAYVSFGTDALPIFEGLAALEVMAGDAIVRLDGAPVDGQYVSGSMLVRRIGYDLFSEVAHLLRRGQPRSDALSPTLELHIAILRQLLQSSGVSYLEIPPRPDGYEFICCLTHDLDFYGLARHRLDRTMAGFLARATWGTFVDLVRGRRTASEALANWTAAASLPFVLLGATRDPWIPIDDYSAADGAPATFFVVPFKARPGMAADGAVVHTRAVAYQASDIRADLERASSRGCEVAVHGIDAWRDTAAGCAERAAVGEGSGGGIRMHWLYFGPDSPALLEAARFDYDSTCGYNDAVGFRSGTSQAFQPPGADRLLELPMAIMDTALFFPDRMGLSADEGLNVCQRVVAQVRRFGGTLVVNWHDRSLAPERLWVRPYRALLAHIRGCARAWFATGSDAVAWFRWRRAIRFVVGGAPDDVTVIAPKAGPRLPGGRVMVHRGAAARVEDLPLAPGVAMGVAL